MASTYVTSYTLVDSVNTQSPSATQYNTNIGTGTLSIETYTPSSPPVIEAALRLLNPGAILNDGYSQKALYELLLMIQVNWDNAMAALDDESLTKSDYESLAAIGPISGDYDSTFATATVGLKLGLEFEPKVNIFPSGVGTRELAIFCQAIATQFAACTANLDADATLNDVNYASTLDIDFTNKTGMIPPLGTAVPFSIVHPDGNGINPCSYITTNGIRHEALVDFLNTVVTQHNLLWVKLDADI